MSGVLLSEAGQPLLSELNTALLSEAATGSSTSTAVNTATLPAGAAVAATVSGEQFVQRIAALFPNNWAGDDAKATGNVHSFLLTIGNELTAVLASVQYDFNAARLQTATAPELDTASVDFFGSTLPRPAGMTDANFAAEIIAGLFQPAATRPAISTALENLTGVVPRMIEPWNVLDTGWWRGVSFWNVDSPQNPARWGNGSLRYQGFVETSPPAIPAVGPNNPILTWGTAYWNVPGYFFSIISATPEVAVYNKINALKAEGTVIWVKLVASTTSIITSQTGTAPSSVTGLTVSAVTDTATLTWGAPTIGSAPFAYTVFYRPTGSTTWLAGPTIASSPATVSGLQSNVNYDFEVIVRNTAGQAPSGVVSAATLKVPPGPATSLVVTSIGSTALTLTWQMPVSGTPPFVCFAQYRVSGTTTWTPFGSAGNYTAITITGLLPATAYDLEVVTSNA